VDASFGSPPRPGFRELIDLSSLKIPFLQGAIEVQRSFMQTGAIQHCLHRKKG
jgi:hypothetical protein